MKTEILHDYGTPGSAGAAASLRTALTATTGHWVNGIAHSPTGDAAKTGRRFARPRGG
jgi:hypothetical protein